MIDADYRDEVKAVVRSGKIGSACKEGDRICQLVLVPILEIELDESQELSDTDRGAGGFGSIDKTEAPTAEKAVV